MRDTRCLLAYPSEPSADNYLTLHISNESRARRAAKEAKEAPAQPAPEKVKVEVKKFVKIGRPGYKGSSAAPVVADTPWLLELASSALLWAWIVHQPF